jgi:indolepyruvate ferredoxin oxidoreductase, beta subunit
LGAALALHEVRAVNMVMTGAASHFLPLPETAYVDALKVRLPARFVDVNARAFRAGRDLVARPGERRCG